MRRPRIKRTTEPIGSPDGDVYLMRPSAENDIRIEKPNEEQRQLLEALDGEHTLEQLHERFGEEAVDDTISQLQELEVVEDAADDDLVPAAELARFDRQLRYFSDIGAPGLTPSECQRRLREAKVAVLGVGGLGGWAALVAGQLRGRRDVADRRRPGRDQQPQPPDPLHRGRHRPAQGRGGGARGCAPSTRRCGSPRRRGGSRARPRSPTSSTAPTSSSTPPTGPPTTSSAGATRPASRPAIPYITMSHFPPIARVGPLYVPGETGCFACQETAYRREYPLFDVAVEQRRAQTIAGGDAGPGLRPDRRPGRDRDHAPADRAGRALDARASPTSTTCGRWRSNARPSCRSPTARSAATCSRRPSG